MNDHTLTPELAGVLAQSFMVAYHETNVVLYNNGLPSLQLDPPGLPNFDHAYGVDTSLYPSFAHAREKAISLHSFWCAFRERCEKDPEFKAKWDELLLIARLTED